jgi:hypothetical protein
MGKAKLRFIINQGLLVGTVADKPVHMFVASGGGGGRRQPTAKDKGKKLKPSDYGAVNNPFSIDQKMNDARGIRGGTIPAGGYTIGKPYKHPRLGKAAFLDPDKSNQTFNRGGFFIHGRGVQGSDGCLVPLDPSEFQQLMAGLTKDAGGRLVVDLIWDEGPKTDNTMIA